MAAAKVAQDLKERSFRLFGKAIHDVPTRETSQSSCLGKRKSDDASEVAGEVMGVFGFELQV